MSIKLLAIDIDDTLLTSSHEVHSAAPEMISHALEAGVKVVLCTGRATPSAMRYTKELGLKDAGQFLITYNGAVTTNLADDTIFADATLDLDDIRTLFDVSEEIGAHAHAIADGGIFTPNNPLSPYTVREAWLTDLPLFYQPVDELNESLIYNKFMMVDEPDILDRAQAHMKEHYSNQFTALRSQPYYLEMIHPQASKGKAVAYLAEQLGINLSDTMGIGDSGNDLDLITTCGIGVAVGNAIDELKDLADYIAPTNDDGGVAHAIERFILKS